MLLCCHPQSEGVMNLFSIHHRVHQLIHELQTKVTVLKERPSALKSQTSKTFQYGQVFVAMHFLMYYLGDQHHTANICTTIQEVVVDSQRE